MAALIEEEYFLLLDGFFSVAHNGGSWACIFHRLLKCLD